jgi:5-formyltetrahydrofolate cyclo-ligase
VNIAERKSEFRRIANAAIAELSADVRRASDAAICDVVLSLPAFVIAKQVLAYWPLADEVDLRAALFAATESGKAVFLPVTRGRMITFRRWQPQGCMTAGALGVQEPAGKGVPLRLASIVLVPGRAFSPKGRRLGRGGGFYDRAWRKLEGYRPRIGIGYSCQLFTEVPHDEHDSVVDLLVCERGVVSGVGQ